MTQEDFANECLRIAAGDMHILTPCCANCEHYINHENGGVIYKNGKVVREVNLPDYWACSHPTFNDDEEELWTKPEDFCSYFKERTNNK